MPEGRSTCSHASPARLPTRSPEAGTPAASSLSCTSTLALRDERPEEIEGVPEGSSIPLCPDTGHVMAGGDPVTPIAGHSWRCMKAVAP